MTEKFCNLIINPEKALKKVPKSGEIPTSKEAIKNTFSIAGYSIIESLSSAIVGFIDMAMVAALGTAAITSIGLTNQPKFICLAIFFALNAAVTAIVSRRFGQKNREGANDCLMQALSVALVLSIIVCGAAFVFAENIMLFVGAKEDTISGATAYFQIVLIGAVFLCLNMVINTAQRAVGKTSITLTTNLIANGINIVFNFFLITGKCGFPALGVAGAAIATTLGNVVAFIVALTSINKKDGYLKFQFKKLFKFTKETMRSVVKVASGALTEQLCLRVGFLLFAIIVAKLGTDAFAAHQIGMNVISVSFACGDGLSVAAATLVGQNMGKERNDLAVLYGKLCQKLGLMFAFVLFIVFMTCGRVIYAIFQSPDNVVEMGVIIMRIAAVIALMQISNVIYIGALRGAGDVRYVAVISLVSVTIVRPLLGYILCFTASMGLTGVWLALLADQTLRLCFSYTRFKTSKWTKIKV